MIVDGVFQVSVWCGGVLYTVHGLFQVWWWYNCGWCVSGVVWYDCGLFQMWWCNMLVDGVVMWYACLRYVKGVVVCGYCFRCGGVV